MSTTRHIHDGFLVGLAVARVFWEALTPSVRRQMLPLMDELERAADEWKKLSARRQAKRRAG